MYKELFLFSECSSGGLNGSPLEVNEGFPPQMQLGWMLFLALRMHVLNQFPDLVTCTNGLLAIIVCRHSLLMYFLHIGLFDGYTCCNASCLLVSEVEYVIVSSNVFARSSYIPEWCIALM